MAERRMLSIKITSSARFLRMSHASQALYMHLVMNADDDGVVEAFSIMRLAAANEENLQELADRKFIRILNDDLVAHILDWDENNKIRSDRKRDSIYKDLLEQSDDDVAIEVIEADTGEASNDGLAADCGQVTADCGQVTADCGQVTADCPHRIGKDRLGEDRIGEYRLGEYSSTNTEREADTQIVCADAHTSCAHAHTREGGFSADGGSVPVSGVASMQGRKPRAPSVPYGEIMESYNTICVSLTPIKVMSGSRKQAVKGRFLKEFHSDLGEVCAFFRKVEASDFLCGRGNSDWSASFDWLMKPKNTVKVLEGTYDNKKPRAPDIPQIDIARRAIEMLEGEGS